METLHEMFFGDDGIFPSIGLNKTEIKKRCRVDLDKSFIDPSTEVRAFEAVVSFLFKKINPKVFKSSCIELLHPTSNAKEEREWRKACKVFCDEVNIPMPSFQIMKQPIGIEVFEYFNTLVDSMGAIQNEMKSLEGLSKAELEADEEMTLELLGEAKADLAAEEENEKLLLDEEKQTKVYLLQASQEAENARLPTDNDSAELIAITNRLQNIHDKAGQVAETVQLLEGNDTTTRRLIAMESNSLNEIINDGRDCENIVEELVNQQKSGLMLTKHNDAISSLQEKVDQFEITKQDLSADYKAARGRTRLPKRREILSELSNSLQETLDFDPKTDMNNRRTTTWKPIRRDTMAGVEIVKARSQSIPLREKTPPRCPSPTKRARGETIAEPEIDDTDEFNFFSLKNHANSTGLPGTAANQDDSVDFSDLDLSGIE